jgi:hypothetical protein
VVVTHDVELAAVPQASAISTAADGSRTSRPGRAELVRGRRPTLLRYLLVSLLPEVSPLLPVEPVLPVEQESLGPGGRQWGARDGMAREPRFDVSGLEKLHGADRVTLRHAGQQQPMLDDHG